MNKIQDMLDERCQICGRGVITDNTVNGKPLCFDCKYDLGKMKDMLKKSKGTTFPQRCHICGCGVIPLCLGCAVSRLFQRCLVERMMRPPPTDPKVRKASGN